MAYGVLRQCAAEHFQNMLGGEQGIEDAIQATASGSGDCLRLWRQMPRMRAGQMKLTLQVGQGDVEIFHRHVGRAVAEQFHHGGKPHAGAKHFCCVGVSPMPHAA